MELEDTQGDPTQTIVDLIADHCPDDLLVGVNYYHNENDIKDRQIWYYEDGQKKADAEATNHRVRHNWHKLLVDQKVGYLLGRPPVIASDDETFSEHLNYLLGKEWDDVLQELGKNASNKGTEWLHPFIDNSGNFRYIIVPAEQCIPVYGAGHMQTLMAMLRYYTTIIDGEETIRAEWWTSDGVRTYTEADGSFVLESEDGHFTLNGQACGWGQVPFVEFANNKERYGDLRNYKELVDVYDVVVSDLANDLTDIQKFLFVLKGYGGQSLTEFVQNLRYYRAIQVDPEQGAGVDTIGIDPQITAIDSFLDRQEENIFLFGQGVNVKTDRFGNAPSGIALKFLYGLLDLKCNIMARRFSVAIGNFCWFVARFLEITGVGNYDPESVKITFTKSLVSNDLELSQIAVNSTGIISQETIVANHPWVDNAQAEMDKLAEEQKSRVDLSQYLEGDDGQAEGET